MGEAGRGGLRWRRGRVAGRVAGLQRGVREVFLQLLVPVHRYNRDYLVMWGWGSRLGAVFVKEVE